MYRNIFTICIYIYIFHLISHFNEPKLFNGCNGTNYTRHTKNKYIILLQKNFNAFLSRKNGCCVFNI